ncbi:MAG: sulfatase-like hydrolase/transferase, partial [Bacteroidetes bacterium]|nr:sulfatase-like hydrolase/transferase [Bacteroidota bacterium]
MSFEDPSRWSGYLHTQERNNSPKWRNSISSLGGIPNRREGSSKTHDINSAQRHNITSYLYPMTKNYHLFFFWLWGIMIPFFSCHSLEKNTPPPNIIVLLADDLGYGDLSVYGSQSIHTPNIDHLAAEGMRFSRFYAGSAVCSPSRACLLTGKFPLRHGVTRHFNDREMHLTPLATTIPQLLKNQGYQSAHIGKWHLGGLRIQDFEARQKGKSALPGPLEHGFDHYLCNIEDPLIRADLITNRQLYRQGGNTMVRNDQRADTIHKHWTEIKVDEAISLLDRW